MAYLQIYCINKQGYESLNLPNNKSSGLLLWLEPHHQPPLHPSKKKHTSLVQLTKNMHFLPLNIVAASLFTFSIPVSIWEQNTTEQQKQLSVVVRWSEAVERKIFTVAGIFGKHVLVCTHILRYKNPDTNQIFQSTCEQKNKNIFSFQQKGNEHVAFAKSFLKLKKSFEKGYFSTNV